MSVASMTGFGRARGALSDRLGASVVISSVNHRYLDVQVRTNLREELPEAEAVARELIAERLGRGRVAVQIHLERTEPAGTRVLVDGDAVASALDQLGAVAGGSSSPLEVRDVLGIPGLVSVYADETLLAGDELAALGELVRGALDLLVEMRRAEGVRLREQILAELGQLGSFLDWFEPQLEDLRAQILARIERRMAELIGPEVEIDGDRLVQEAALQAERSDVAEEVVRLRSHVAQLEQRLGAGGLVGRALDFLCQEVNRELNTIGSKCREPGVAERLVDAKAATERIREQVQNLQ